MSLATLLNRPVTIVRRSASGDTDPYGNEIEAETSTETVGELQQQQRTEPGAQGELSQTNWLLILPAGTEIGTADAIIVNGQEYEMVGDPWPARNPRTHEQSHVECTVRRTAGSEETGS
jgi:hypothetical protein